MLTKELLIQRIEKSLNSIRPHLITDGGNIEVVDVIDNIVQVKLLGACGTCPMSEMTMKAGVELSIINAIPEIQGVETVN